MYAWAGGNETVSNSTLTESLTRLGKTCFSLMQEIESQQVYTKKLQQ